MQMDVHWWYHLFYETLRMKPCTVTNSYLSQYLPLLILAGRYEMTQTAETRISANRQKMIHKCFGRMY